MSILAGNSAVITVTFTPPEGVTVTTTPTVAAAITAPAGTSVALDGDDIDVSVDDNVVTVEATWEIPDDTAAGRYVVTFDLSGSMVAAAEVAIDVDARWEPDVPTA